MNQDSNSRGNDESSESSFDDLMKILEEERKDADNLESSNEDDSPGRVIRKPASKSSKRKYKRKASRKVTPRTVSNVDIKKEPEKPYEPFSLFPKELVKVFAGLVPFGVISAILNDRSYLLTESEKDYLSDYWDKVIYKYLPGFIEEYGPEYALLGAISFVFIGKTDFMKIKEPKQESENAE